MGIRLIVFDQKVGRQTFGPEGSPLYECLFRPLYKNHMRRARPARQGGVTVNLRYYCDP